MENGKEWQFLRSCSFRASKKMRRSVTIRPGFVEIPSGIRCAPVFSMPKSRDLRVRSFEFTVAIVRLCRAELTGDSISRRLAFQLVDAAGSVGANLEESGAGQTKPDFIAKQFIALKEARESRFWLRVISAAYPQTATNLKPFIQESSELVAMVTASIRTAKSNPRRGEPPPSED
jgi:four helix bundle protein